MDLQRIGEYSNEPGGLRSLVREVVDTEVAEPFGAYVFAFDEPGADIGRLLEREVFLQTFGNTAEQLADEYGAYESSSLFFCVIDHRRATIAGVMRMILPTCHGPGLKSLVDLELVWGTSATQLLAQSERVVDIQRTWDIATLAVAPEYRAAAAAGLVGTGLYQSFVRAACRVGVDSLVMIVDHVALRMLRIRVRVPLVALAEGRPYLGSQSSVPVLLHLVDWKEHLRRVDPVLLGVIFEGRGIEAALRPIDLNEAGKRALRLMPP